MTLTKEPVTFRIVEKRRGDTMFTQSKEALRWGSVIDALIKGETVFVPGLSRPGLETLRSMLSRRTTLRLRSQSTIENEEEGYLLRLVARK